MPNHIRRERCTVERGSGGFCDAASAPDVPFPICGKHAVELYGHLQGVLSRVSPSERVALMAPGVLSEMYERRAVEQRNYAAGTHVVYYLRVGDYIKIGKTSNLRARLADYPPFTELLVTEPGNDADEARRLSQFREHLAHGKEWFRPAPELLKHIDSLKQAA